MNGRPAIGIALLGFALVCPVASADGLRLGVQAGLERWNVDLDVQLVDQSGTIEADFAPGVGVLGQYIFRAPAEDERPFFVGFELGYAAQNISEAGTFDVSGVPVETTADISWSVDALWLAGYDFGRCRRSSLAAAAIWRASSPLPALASPGRIRTRTSASRSRRAWKSS